MSMMRSGLEMAQLEMAIMNAKPGTKIRVTEEDIEAFERRMTDISMGGASRVTAAQIAQFQQREQDFRREREQMLMNPFASPIAPSPISDTPARPSPKVWGGTAELAEQKATYQAAGLEKHWLHNVYIERCKFVESLGYKAVTLPEIGEMLSGEKFEWKPEAVNGHSEYEIDRTPCWPSVREFAERNLKRRILVGTSGPLFRGKTKWRSGPLHDLVVPVPYGVVLLAKEVQEHKCFDYLEVFAPVSSFSEKPMMLPEIDPVLVGVVNNTPQEPAHTTRFFLAKWGDDASPD